MVKFSISKDISIARTMPSKYYLDEKYYNLSLQNIFLHSWQFIVLQSQMKNINTYPFIFLKNSINEPLLLTKSSKGIKCMSNVCTHRGSIICNKPSYIQSIRCPYHGRRFDLNGTLKKAPGFNNVKNFPSNDDNLSLYKIMESNNFIFVSIDPKINIQSIFKDIQLRLGWYPFDDLEFDKNLSTMYNIDVHWSLYCENYLEGFHIPFIHKGLNDNIDIKSYQIKLFENGVLQYTYSSKDNDNMNIPSSYIDSGEDIYAYYYYIFPNIMLNFYKWGLSINIIEPISKNKTKVRFLSYPIAGNSQPINTDSSLDVVEKEDQEIIKSVQKGIRSQAYNRGRYASNFEKGVHHFHRLISRYLS